MSDFNGAFRFYPGIPASTAPLRSCRKWHTAKTMIGGSELGGNRFTATRAAGRFWVHWNGGFPKVHEFQYWTGRILRMIWGTTFEDTTISKKVLFIISIAGSFPVHSSFVSHLSPIHSPGIASLFPVVFPRISTYLHLIVFSTYFHVFPSYSQLTGQQAPYVRVAKIWRTAHFDVLRDTTAFHEIRWVFI